jgi:hypothetical protein
MSRKTHSISRRRAIKGAAKLIGGTLATSAIGPFLARAAAAAEENASPLFFSDDQFELLGLVVDLVIPETDTPGAHAAGVHYFIDLMMAEWAAPERQGRWVNGLQAIDERASAAGSAKFVELGQGKQLELLRTIDNEAFAADATDTFFREFKRMVLFAYYSSEAGATVELQYEPLIPEYKACVPIDDIGRAWFWLGFSYGL